MIFAGICAAGRGLRFGTALPKQFERLNDRPIITYSVDELLKWRLIDKIFIAVSKDYIDYSKGLFHYLSPASVRRIAIIEGGELRSETAALLTEAAMNEPGACDDDIMLTHDAARPLVSIDAMKRCVAAAQEYDAAGTAISAKDTVLRCKDGFITDAPPREEMFLAQTPQSFRIGVFKEIWNSMSPNEKLLATDVCGMLFRKGVRVKIIYGEEAGVKITVREELDRMAKTMINKQ